MNWTLASRQLNMETRDIKLTLIFLMTSASHSLASVRKELNLD